VNAAEPDEPRTRGSLALDLRRLGLESGDVVLVHSSLSALGCVCGGAVAVVQALLDAVGPAAAGLMAGHRLDSELGEESPLAALEQADAKVLLLGAGYDTCASPPLRNQLLSSRSSRWCGYRVECGWVPSRSPEVPLAGPRPCQPSA
jgi:aminoglycoside 3-N-acetyltransferase